MKPTEPNFYQQADAYLQGRLSPAEMHALEQAALSDPFLSDALEGFEGKINPQHQHSLALLHQRLAPKQSTSRPAMTVAWKKWTGWSAAAAVLVIATFVIWPSDKEEAQLAELKMMKKAPVETAAAPAPPAVDANNEVAVARKRTPAQTPANITQNGKKNAWADASSDLPETNRSAPKEAVSESSVAAAMEGRVMGVTTAPVAKEAAPVSPDSNVTAFYKSAPVSEEVTVSGYGNARKVATTNASVTRIQQIPSMTGKQILFSRLQGSEVSIDTVARPGFFQARYQIKPSQFLIKSVQPKWDNGAKKVENKLNYQLMLERRRGPLPADSGLIYLKVD